MATAIFHDVGNEEILKTNADFISGGGTPHLGVAYEELESFPQALIQEVQQQLKLESASVLKVLHAMKSIDNAIKVSHDMRPNVPQTSKHVSTMFGNRKVGNNSQTAEATATPKKTF